MGGGLDSHSLGQGRCRSLLAFVLKGPDSGLFTLQSVVFKLLKTLDGSERAKGAEKASCGEMVVPKAVLESPLLLCPSKLCPENTSKP